LILLSRDNVTISSVFWYLTQLILEEKKLIDEFDEIKKKMNELINGKNKMIGYLDKNKKNILYTIYGMKFF